jgi:predicted  nucleic acid-binding Zn-ribbon protein
MTTAPQFSALLEVQNLDTAIDQHRHRLTHLPEAAVVADLDAQAAAVSARRSRVVVRCDEVAGRQEALEAELAATEERSRAVSARLYGGQVSAARDLQAMAADIESLKARASDFEDQILVVLDEREPLDAAITADDEELAALAERRQVAEAARVEAGQVVATELDELLQQRAGAADVIASDLLADYERIRSTSGGIGAARLIGNHCDGCHLTMPSMELDRIRRASPDAVMHCDECGRILVHT